MSTILNEEVATQTWLQSYLAADATLGALITGVWVHSVPRSQALPVVKIDRQSASDIYTVNLYRALSDLLYLVRGIDHWKGSGQQDWSTAQAIGNRLDVLLHKHSEATASIQVDIFREESFVDEQTSSDGTTFLHCGGMYRIRTHAL